MKLKITSLMRGTGIKNLHASPLLPFFLYSNLKGKSRGHHILSRILKLRFFSRNFLCFVLLRDKDQNRQKMSI